MDNKPEKDKCDTIIRGKYILTFDNDASVIKDGAVAVSGGKITDLGAAADISSRFLAAKEIDAGNSIILPGLVNTHTHAAMSYFRGMADDLPLNAWLNEHIWPAEAKHVKPDFIRRATELAILEMVRAGTTCFNDMYFFEDVVAEAVNASGVRAVLGTGILDFPTPDAANPGEAIARSIELHEEYGSNDLISIALCPHSVFTCSKETLETAGELSKKKRMLLHIHVSETKEELDNCRRDHGMSPVKYLDELGVLSRLALAAHAVWVDEDDLGIFAERGVKVSHNPISNMKLASGVAPVRRMLEMGVCVGIGTDGAASNNTLDLFSEIRAAATLHKVMHLDPSILKAEELLKMATASGAKALGLEDKTGSLETGKAADLIAVNLDKPHSQPFHNPYSHLVYCAMPSDIEYVMVNGKLLLERRQAVTMDEERILAEAAGFISQI